jgi:small-conductance mechanosensitive channel
MKKIVYKPKQVRLFLILLMVFLALFIFRFTKGRTAETKAGLVAIEAVLISFFLAVPKLFFPLFRIIVILSSYIGAAVFGILSVITFYAILTPVSLFMRLFGKKFMEHKIESSRETYYEEGLNDHNIQKQF